MSNRVRIVHETRAKRARRSRLLKAFVWVFIVIFAFSIAGGVIAFTVTSR
jgi:hypothetical protein